VSATRPVRTAPKPRPYTPSTPSVIVPLDGSERAERALGPGVQLADRMEASLLADYEIIDGFDAADSLLDAATRFDASLIAVGTHGRQGIARIVLGSVTTRIVRSASVPVMVACR